MTSRFRSSRGFTLLETVVAMSIMTMAIVALANAWSGNVVRVRNARVNNTIATLLERKMTEYEIKYRGKPIEEIVEEETGDFGAQFPGYRWEMASQPFEMPDLSGLLIAREGGADELTLMIPRAIAEAAKQMVKEVRVTVAFKAKTGGEVKHRVATLFVDYSKEVPLPQGIPGLQSGGGGGGAAGGSGGGSATGGGSTGGAGGSGATDGGSGQ